MSLIEEALRRIQDSTIAEVQGKPKAPTAQRPVNASTGRPSATREVLAQSPTGVVHPWATTAPSSAGAAPPTTRALFAVAFALVALTAVLVIGGVFWVGRTLGSNSTRVPSPGAQMRPRASAEMSAQPTQPAGSPAPATRTPTASADSSRSEFILSGVVEGLGEPYAVINGLVVRAGDGIEGATVLTIGDGAVTLRRPDGKQLALRVSP